MQAQLPLDRILHLFERSEVYLLVGAGIVTLGLLSGAFLLLRRRFEPLLFWFTLLALVYGTHLILDYQLLWFLGFRPEAFRRIVIALECIVPVPAFFFFDSLNLLGRAGRLLALVGSPVAVGLGLATLIVGPEFRIANHIFVVAALCVLGFALLRNQSLSPDTRLIRNGLFVFLATALYGNVTGVVGRLYYNIEPFGFVIMLACFGVVVGRRTFAQEQQLSVIQNELAIARQIQHSILPEAFPVLTTFSVAARYLPMTSVAGDFYDFLVADDGQAGILVADVSGHGVPAALIASMVKLAAKTQIKNATNPSELLSGMNAALLGNTQKQFVTAAYVYIDATRGELRYAAAAHPAMLLLRDRQVLRFVENGLMLAAFSFATYTTMSHPISPGDRLLLYTDGMLEAADQHNEEFGEERLSSLLESTANLSPAEAADRIVEAVQHWSTAQSDDLTVLICDYRPGLDS